MSASIAAIDFLSLRDASQSVTFSQSNNTVGYALTPESAAACSQIVTVSGPPADTFTLTPTNAGTCTLVVLGDGGRTASVSVTVTQTTITVR